MRAALGAAGRAGLSVACRPWTARRGYACAPAMRCDGAESARSAPTSSLVRDFANALRAHEVVRPGDRVVVCVSGGADSVALLHLLSEVREEWRLDLHVLHFDHRRRAESAEERAFVEALGARLRAEVHVRVPDSPFADASFQANARSWRRSEARALLERVDAHVILQGHHADDQTETILLKLFRGCHLSKVAGMAHREGVFGRPLLDFPKSALISYLEARSEPWREDASNADEAYLRNRVRHDLVPALRGVTHGSLEDRLRALTAQSAHLREWLDDVPKATVPGAFGTRSDVGELDLDVWFALPTMAREDQLYDYVERSTANRLGYRNLRKIMRQMHSTNVEWSWRLENDWELVRVGQRAFTRPLATESIVAAEAGDDEGEASSIVQVGRGVSLSHPPGWTVRAIWNDDDVARDLERGARDGVSLANLPEACSLALRYRKPGDRFRPRTRDAPVRLKDWMRDAAVPLHERDRTPVVTLGEEVLAVYPSSVSARAAPPAEGVGSRDGAVLHVVIDGVAAGTGR